MPKKYQCLSSGKRNPRRDEIVQVIDDLRHKYILKDLLDYSGIPRSSYYYCHNVMSKPTKNKSLKEEIKIIFEHHKERYGYRRITLELRNQGIFINHKKVLRLMKELGIKGKVKRVKYRSYKGNVGKVAPNILNRKFTVDKPYKKLTTDVTQFSIASGKVYLSPIKDLFNGEIISYNISERPLYSQVNDMLTKAFEIIPNNSGAILHSDQGWQYQMGYYQETVKKKGLIQSMSRKGNCLDNSPMESFFGTLKNEMFYGNEKDFSNFDELKKGIDEYIYYYNNDRIKVKLKGLSPVQYRIQSQ